MMNQALHTPLQAPSDSLKLALRAVEVLRSNCGQLSPSASMLVANAIAALVDVQHEVHPDTVRLNHLIAKDHCQIGHVADDGTDKEGTIEKIEFIFENLHGGDTLDVVRASIDQSIKALS